MIQRFFNLFAIQFAQKNENLSRVSAEIFAAGKKKKQSPKKESARSMRQKLSTDKLRRFSYWFNYLDLIISVFSAFI